MNEDNKIDFVLTWVDGNDPEWLKEKEKYSDNQYYKRNNVNRYRDWDNLKYWFRGVEKFAPWFNKIYFVTCGHYPKWLNLNNPKLKHIKHEDYIKKEYLPTFNVNPIELNLHRIEGLNEKFIYFNDDTFIIDKVKETDFFCNDKPKYVAGSNATYSTYYDDIFPHILLNDVAIINEFFDKKESMKKNFTKWFNLNYGFKTIYKTILLLQFKKFTAFTDLHLPSPLLKSTMEELWNKKFEVLDKTSSNKFRSIEDVNQYLFKWYDIARGNFEPAKVIGRYYNTTLEKDRLLKDIEKQKYSLICFSDDMEIDFEKTKEEVNKVFEKILPEKSSFEI